MEKLKKAGITAFKIEGRNRDARYVDSVVRIYRKALDKKLTKEEIKEGLDELKKVYNRGFSSGFYLGTPTSDDFSTVENSSATTTKQFIGKVTHYYPQAKAGAILLSTGELKVGDNIAIIGNTTGIEKIKIERFSFSSFCPIKSFNDCGRSPISNSRSSVPASGVTGIFSSSRSIIVKQLCHILDILAKIMYFLSSVWQYGHIGSGMFPKNSL